MRLFRVAPNRCADVRFPCAVEVLPPCGVLVAPRAVDLVLGALDGESAPAAASAAPGLPVSASAVPGMETIAAPMPRAIASCPIRPM